MFNDSIHRLATGAAVLPIILILDSPAAAQVRKADFNGDGYGDLAIGAPAENEGRTGSGVVHILYGTKAFGLHAYGNQVLHPWQNDVPFGSHLGQFGSALAWGDFNNDTFTDLAVGMPGYALPGDAWGNRGAVRVYYGRQYGGLVGADTQLFIGDGEDYLFGTSLAVGDFNGDKYMDLAIGAPQSPQLSFGEGSVGGGEVLVIYGGEGGLNLTGADRRSQASVGVPGEPEHWDAFGFSLAAGDFGHGPEDDLAIGAPGENNGEGAVNIIYGSAWGGLTHANAQLLQQGTDGMAGAREAGDRFGFSLAAGDFNLNGHADLAIGSPGEDIGRANVGLVHVVYGGPNGLDSYFGQAFGQDWGDFDLQGGAVENDNFGWSLATGNFGKDSAADLAVGVPGDTITGAAGSGAVNVVYGSFFTRLVATGNQLWAQTDVGSGDLAGKNEYGDRFGYSLAALDVGWGSRVDLVVGVPGEAVNGRAQAGAVNVIFSTASGLAIGNNQLWTQDSVSSGTIEVQGVAEARDYFGYSVSGASSGFLLLVP